MTWVLDSLRFCSVQIIPAPPLLQVIKSWQTQKRPLGTPGEAPCFMACADGCSYALLLCTHFASLPSISMEKQSSFVQQLHLATGGESLRFSKATLYSEPQGKSLLRLEAGTLQKWRFTASATNARDPSKCDFPLPAPAGPGVLEHMQSCFNTSCPPGPAMRRKPALPAAEHSAAGICSLLQQVRPSVLPQFPHPYQG